MGELNNNTTRFRINEDGSINRGEIINNSGIDFLPRSAMRIAMPGKYMGLIILMSYLILIILGTCTALFEGGNIALGIFFIGIAVCIVCVVVILKYSLQWKKMKEEIFKDIEYVGKHPHIQNKKIDRMLQTRYLCVMSDKKIGLYDVAKGVLIIPPKFDSIRWVIPNQVLATLNGIDETFFDVLGKQLHNVPESYLKN